VHRLSQEGRVSQALLPTANNRTLSDALLSIQAQAAYTTSDAPKLIRVDMGGAQQVCGTASKTRTDVTLTNVQGDAPPFTVWNYLTGATASMYFETVQVINCTCGSSCGGYITLTYDGVSTNELPYSATPATVQAALAGE
jgi:hypothetical protein